MSTALLGAAATALIVVGSAVPRDIKQWATFPKPDPAGERIRAATRPDDLIVTVGCDWDPKTLYFADRRGLMLRDNNLGVWKHDNVDDYNYLFSCDPAENVNEYHPAGYDVMPTSTPDLWRLVRAPRS
jgi:hypothetical protein